MQENVVEKEVKVVKTVFVDHKIKKIYAQTDSYQSLNESDMNFFDAIFPVLWINGPVSYSNEFFGERFGYAKSTIEKKLRKIERAGLIVRDLTNNLDHDTGKWNTIRIISLDPFLKTRILRDLESKRGNAVAAEDSVDESIEDSIDELVEEAEASEVIKKPVLKKYKR